MLKNNNNNNNIVNISKQNLNNSEISTKYI